MAPLSVTVSRNGGRRSVFSAGLEERAAPGQRKRSVVVTVRQGAGRGGRTVESAAAAGPPGSRKQRRTEGGAGAVDTETFAYDVARRAAEATEKAWMGKLEASNRSLESALSKLAARYRELAATRAYKYEAEPLRVQAEALLVEKSMLAQRNAALEREVAQLQDMVGLLESSRAKATEELDIIHEELDKERDARAALEARLQPAA